MSRAIDRFTKEANQGIIGLSPPDEWSKDNTFWVPQEGYDSGTDGNWSDDNCSVWQSAHARAELLELAEQMAERWKAWGKFVSSLPDEAFGRPTEEERG